MDCNVIERELLAFHFGEVDDPSRARMEAHLLACADCLGAFLELKRAMEAPDPRPGEAARLRLRDAVMREVGAPMPAAAPRWQALVAAGVAAAALFGAAATVSLVASSPGPPPRLVSSDR